MRTNGILSSICLCFLLTQVDALQHSKFKSMDTQHTNIIPGRFLVEYTSPGGHDNSLSDALDGFESSSKTAYFNRQKQTNIRTVDVGASSHENFLSTVLDHERTVAVYPVTYVSRPNAVSHGYYNQIDAETTERIQAHQLTQINRLHGELGLTGQGVKICIIDSGVDYNHPALGGGFGPGYKISFGQDLVGNDFDPMSKSNVMPADGTPPLDDCGKVSEKAVGHGTHVTGIIAGVDESKGFTGVAPNATIGVWRVFGCEGGSSSDIIMKAMVQAQKAGCDVINMSLGNDAPWSEQPHAAFAQELSNQGISVVVSNGNDGEAGAFTVTDPAGASDVLSVASVDNPHFLGSLFSLTSASKKIGPYSYQVAPEASAEIPDGNLVLGGSPTTFHACDIENIPKDVKGQLALVTQGPCTIVQQESRVAEAGAIGLIFVDTLEGDPVRAPYFNTTIPIATISSVSGHQLISALKNSNETMYMHFERNAFVFQSSTANTVSYFSSIGPTNELDMKPSFGAIGSNVFSTLPDYLGGWGTKSGTSMASPYIAGTVALLREAFAGQNILASVLHEKLANYAKPLDAAKDQLESPLRQGAGLIQAYDAIKEPLHVSPAKISFNDTKSLTDVYKTHSLKVSNTGTEAVQYEITSISSASISPYGHNNSQYRLISSSHEKFYSRDVSVQVDIQPSRVQLNPGESQQVVVSVQLPKEFNAKEQVMYGGYVQFRREKGDGAQVHVPYFGVLGSLYELPTLDSGALNVKDNKGHVYGQNETFHFSLSDEASAPSIGFRLSTPSRRFTIELVQEEGEKHVGYIVPTYNYAERDLSSQTMKELNPWLGALVVDENLDSKPFTVSPGTYRIKWSALKMFGDLEKSQDWVVQTSGPIDIAA
ncbi:peptidase S8/S53 domain-containing protein [Mucor mucedo]|uniref:peptidase S8/S53 domain-containing protein n=1 Tax=Mucor mucedo TaxID=29922 RepID=UPI0022211620|nr:peptidase S8/S53 domain-containing protein [Mucor mucedo]KAI7895490.1 peptidase S8/S53 domain-containing protein [Mucor mucedo]